MRFALDMITDIKELVNELTTGLNRLSLSDNFAGFEKKDLSINAGETARIHNELRDAIPNKFIVVKQQGNGLLTIPSANKDKTNVWNQKALFLKNNGTETVKITVIFMR